jgi:GNAT superfamily N-acetyltransferase
VPQTPQARAAETPDRSVRLAWVADAHAMGRVQARAWTVTYRDILPGDVLAALDSDALAARWAGDLRRPPAATHRALVALEANTVVGFAATGPSEDPDADPVRDAEMTVLVVHPDALGRGHGSRLLSAVVDTGRADGFTRATTWVFAQDDTLRAFLESAGWAPDGAHREMVIDAETTDAPPVRQVRLHTSLEG